MVQGRRRVERLAGTGWLHRKKIRTSQNERRQVGRLTDGVLNPLDRLLDEPTEALVHLLRDLLLFDGHDDKLSNSGNDLLGDDFDGTRCSSRLASENTRRDIGLSSTSSTEREGKSQIGLRRQAKRREKLTEKLPNSLPRREVSCVVADRDGFNSRDPFRPDDLSVLNLEGVQVDLVDVDVLVDASLGRNAC